MTQPGAPAAYRGYRLQALYILKRILRPGSEEDIFLPEGFEDLDILDRNGKLRESIQVKSYPRLVLSNLLDSTDSSPDSRHPAKVQPFFRRALDLLKSQEPETVKVVNFGNISPEMLQAWKNTPIPKNSKARKTSRQTVTEKFRDKEYTQEDIDLIFSKVELISLYENKVQSEILDFLSDTLTGIDRQNAFDLLNFWIYIASEQQQKITKSHIIEKIKHIGKFLSHRLAHHMEWYNSIRPIEDTSPADEQKKKLEEEFYEGVSARYEHILAGIDLQREDKLHAIHDLFQTSGTVIYYNAPQNSDNVLRWIA